MATQIFEPTLMSGIVYAREIGSASTLMPIGGVQELQLDYGVKKIEQKNFAGGGGNRASIERLESFMVKSKLQDLNVINLARCLRSNASEIAASTVVDELHTAYKGGLCALAHPSPTSVIVKDGANATISMASNYEVRPEGIYFYDDAPAITAGSLAIKVSYAFDGYNVLEMLTRASPLLHLQFAGMNESKSNAPFLVDLWRVQQDLTKSLALISNDAFSVLDFEGEVLLDPTRTGVGISKYGYIRKV